MSRKNKNFKLFVVLDDTELKISDHFNVPCEKFTSKYYICEVRSLN